MSPIKRSRFSLALAATIIAIVFGLPAMSQVPPKVPPPQEIGGGQFGSESEYKIVVYSNPDQCRHGIVARQKLGWQVASKDTVLSGGKKMYVITFFKKTNGDTQEKRD